MPVNVGNSTPAPRIGKIGPYTVFITPPSTPSTPTSPSPRPVSSSPKKTTIPAPPLASPAPAPAAVKTHTPMPPPPVQAPPSQFYSSKASQKSHSTFGFFWDALAKVQNAHESLDGHVAHWFGLNQSKYQWALDDYYESKGANPMDAKTKGLSDKVRNV